MLRYEAAVPSEVLTLVQTVFTAVSIPKALTAAQITRTTKPIMSVYSTIFWPSSSFTNLFSKFILLTSFLFLFVLRSRIIARSGGWGEQNPCHIKNIDFSYPFLSFSMKYPVQLPQLAGSLPNVTAKTRGTGQPEDDNDKRAD
jgi:hypothetical protein